MRDPVASSIILQTIDLNLRRGTMTDYIRPFSQITKNDIPSVGGKGANLGELTHAGLPVPPGFCVTADAYRAFIETTHVGDTIRDLLAATRIDDAENVEKNTAEIRELLNAQPMPPDIAAQVLSGYSRLAADMRAPDADIPVAVRSSATAEDLPGASFAGQQDTYLNIRGSDALLEYVRKCWASLWTARAVTYRVKQGFDHEQVALAVVVQAMIESEVAGILFTANPVTHSRDELVINASWGLGEAIVSGLVSPDTWIIRKSDGAITLREIADKDLAIHYAPAGGTVEERVSPDRRTIPSLTDSQLAQLAALGIQRSSRITPCQWTSSGGSPATNSICFRRALSPRWKKRSKRDPNLFALSSELTTCPANTTARCSSKSFPILFLPPFSP